jgi:hypothetical protein
MMHSFTWDQEVALCLIQFLQDPELVRYFLAILRPRRRDLLEDEAREFHESLRMTKEGRWKKVAELSQMRKFHAMNASVPITCTLPFDGGMWRNSCLLLKSLRYFRETFIKKEVFQLGEEGDPPSNWDIEQTVSEKIETVNLFLDNSHVGSKFRSNVSIYGIEEARSDFEIFEEDDETDYPYLLVRTTSHGISLTIIN